MSPSVGGQVSEDDWMVLLILGCVFGPLMLLGAIKKVRTVVLGWATRHHMLNHDYLLPVPGTGQGLDWPHVLILAGLLGLLGLVGTLIGRGIMPKKAR